MKRFIICLAALAIWFSGQMDVVAQSGSRADSYQAILNQVSVPDYGQAGGFGQANYGGMQGQPPTLNTVFQEQGTAPRTPAGEVQSSGISYQDSAAVVGAPGTVVEGQVAGPVVSGQGCNSDGGSTVGSPYGAPIYGNVGGQVYAPTAAPVYSTGQSFGCANASCGSAGPSIVSQRIRGGQGSSRNMVFGINGLIFDRDYEDDVFLTRNPSGDVLLSTDADNGNLGGMEFFLGSRNCNGNGMELRYWGLFTDESTYNLGGASFATYLTGLQDIYWPGTGEDLETVVNRATLNTVSRDTEIHNVEANFLRQGGNYTTRSGRCANYELLAGFRWFEFDEEFDWEIAGPAAPLFLAFNNDVDNTLLGFQVGGRSEICMTKKLRFNVGTKLGIFNNRIRASQVITDTAGVYGRVGSCCGPNYNYRDSKSDLSMLGELNLSTAYHFNPCSRLVVGYRAIGVSGIALAADQLNNFNATVPIRSIQSNNDLLLHGSFFGLEFCR